MDDVGENDVVWKVEKVQGLHRLKTLEEVEAVYDDFAPYYDKLVLSLDYRGPAYTAEVVSRIAPNREARILDVACGTGLICDTLHNKGYRHLYGVDLSQTSLEMADKKGTYVKTIHAKFGPEQPLQFDDGYFDVAMSCGSFLPTHLNERCLPEMIRLVKPGGYLVITTRKYIFDGETGDMKLKSGIESLTQEGALCKIAHEESFYEEDGDHKVVGITLIYQVPVKESK